MEMGMGHGNFNQNITENRGFEPSRRLHLKYARALLFMHMPVVPCVCVCVCVSGKFSSFFPMRRIA